MPISIAIEHPDTPEIITLVDELTAILSAPYPPESVHGYSVDKLIAQQVAFHIIRVDGKIAGCGGVQLIDLDTAAPYGELKRMYVRPEFQGQGLAKQLITVLEAYTQDHGVHVLRLETGIYSDAAIGLYTSVGFVEIAPFGDYQPDPNSRFFEKHIG